MKFGIFDHLDDSGLGAGEQYRSRLNLLEYYDRIPGFYCYHLAEHHATPLGLSPSPSVFLSAVAQRTGRIKFGPLVYTLPFYHPLRLIEEISMLDHLSGGRLQMGVGRGVSPREAEFYGIEPGESRARYFEMLEIVRRGLNSDLLNYDGEFYSFRDVPMVLQSLQNPHPPLWYGTNVAEAAVWAAANDVNVVTLLPADLARGITDRYRREWKSLGHSPETIPLMGLSRLLVVGETGREAMEIARRAYKRWRRSFRLLWEKDGVPEIIERLAPDEFDQVMEQGNGFAGSAEEVRDYVRREIETSGANYLVTSLSFGDITEEEAMHSASLYAGEVIPAFT